MPNNPNFLYGGIPEVRIFGQSSTVDPRLISNSSDDQDGPTWRYRALVTYEKPITEFPGDITIPVNAAGSTTVFRAGIELPNNCVGIRFLTLVAGVWAVINGGGLRTIMNNDTFTGVEIKQMTIITDATGTCTIQAVGTGD